MGDASGAITPQRYSQGLTYEGYLGQTSNREKYQESESSFALSSADARFFKDINSRLGGIKALAIVEDWCTDAQRGLPVVAKIAGASGMELRVFYRDKNPDIMNLYLNQGKFQSIPVFAFFSKNLRPLCHWIERPAAASRFMQEMATELSSRKLSDEEIREERRKRNAPMADSWRQETVKELKELLSRAASGTG